MNDNADSGSGAEQKKQGEWKEGLGGGGPGGASNKGGAGRRPGEPGFDSEPVGEPITFSDGKDAHRLWFEEKPGEAKLMVASKEQPVAERLGELQGKGKDLLDRDRPVAARLIGQARAQLPVIQNEAGQVAAMKEAERRAEETYKKHGKEKRKKKGGSKPSRKDKNKKLKADEHKLEAVLKDLFTQMRSMEIRAKVKSDVAGKRVKTEAEETALISSVFGRHNKDGLKGIRFQPSAKQRRILDVLVSASATEPVGEVSVWAAKGFEELQSIGGRMHLYAGRTTIYLFYDREKSFGSVAQKAGGAPGHAEFWLQRDKFPQLLDRIRRDRKRKVLKTADKERIPIHLELTRTPCDGCASSHLVSLIEQAKKGYPDVPFELTIASSFVSEISHRTTVNGLVTLLKRADLLQQKIVLTSSTLWATIEQSMTTAGVKQFDYRQRTFTIDDVREFRAHAKDVQDLIDQAVSKFNRAKKLELTAVERGKGP